MSIGVVCAVCLACIKWMSPQETSYAYYAYMSCTLLFDAGQTLFSSRMLGIHPEQPLLIIVNRLCRADDLLLANHSKTSQKGQRSFQ